MKRGLVSALALLGVAACAGSINENDEEVASTSEELSTAKVTIYADAIASGWSLNGWGWNSTASVVTSPALGTNAVKVTMNAAWAGFVLAQVTNGAGVNIAAGTYDMLEFDINPGATVSPALASMTLDLDNGAAPVTLASVLPSALQANTWTHVRVPMTTLDNTNSAYFRLNFFNATTTTGQSFYIDNVVLGPLPSVGVPAIATSRSTVAGQTCDTYTWYDDAGRARTSDFVDDAYKGGYIRRLTYKLPDGTTRTAIGGVDASTGYQGFGYLVSHYDNGSNGGSSSADSRDGDYSTTLKNNGHSALVWQGRHHLIREYTVDLHPELYRASGRGTVHATVRWLLATGRAPMLFSVTFDASATGANKMVADSRAPYGVLAWDGTASGTAAVSGVSWGDRYKFVSDSSNTGGNLSIKSNWTYNTANTIPFTYVWANSADAEMGMVSTRTYATDVSGEDAGVWFDGNSTIHGSEWASVYCWNKTSANAPNCAQANVDGAGAVMPGTNLWPYQTVNYGLSSGTSTNKKIAWGSDYGAVGWQSVNSFGNRTFTGYPKTSYSTNVVLGRHSDQAVTAEVKNQEANRTTTLTASVGTVATSGPAGVGRTDTVAYSPAGFDPVYGTWRLQANQGTSTFTQTTSSGTLVHPMYVMSGALASSLTVVLDDVMLQSDVDYFASTDGSNVWVTLNRSLTGTHEVSIQTH